MRVSLSLTASLIVFTIVMPLRGQQAPAAGAGSRRKRPVRRRCKSPEIHPDRTVTFRLLAPKATEVTLNGSWDNGTDLKMTKDEAGVWSTTIGPLAPQLWGYWFMVDGVKALDPNNGETQRDGSRYDNLLMISGPESEWWDFKDVPHGTRAGGLVSVADAEDGEPPDDGLHAARLRDRARRSIRCSTCCTAAAATRTRG